MMCYDMLSHRLHSICSILSDCWPLLLLYSRTGHPPSPAPAATPGSRRSPGLPWLLVQQHRDELLVIHVAIAVNVGFADEFLALFLRQLVSERGEDLEEVCSIDYKMDYEYSLSLLPLHRQTGNRILSRHCYEAVALPVKNPECLPNLLFDVSVLEATVAHGTKWCYSTIRYPSTFTS